MTTACEGFELQIGMLQHGALDAREEAALAAHLETCPSCRAFAEIDLVGAARADANAVEWSGLERGVGRLARRRRILRWLAPLFLMQNVVAFLLATGHLPPTKLVLCAPITVALYLGYLWLVDRPFRLLVAAAQDGAALLAGYVAELRRQLSRARFFAGVAGVLAVVSAGAAVAENESRVRLYEIGCALLFGGWAAYECWGIAPRLRRAIAEVVS